MDHLKTLQEYAQQYQDGLITYKEFVLKCVDNMCHRYDDNPHTRKGYASQFADDLAAQLLK